MIKQWMATGVLVLAAAFSAQALAVPITGEVFTEGRFRTDTDNLATATWVTFPHAWTTSGTGDYSAVNGNRREVSYRSFTFNPGLSGPVDPLWSFTVGTDTYSFVMNSVGIVTQSATELSLVGLGMLYITGFDPTPGIWEFTASNMCGTEACIGRFKFSANSSVPEPGTLALLGLGLLGLGLRRRRRA